LNGELYFVLHTQMIFRGSFEQHLILKMLKRNQFYTNSPYCIHKFICGAREGWNLLRSRFFRAWTSLGKSSLLIGSTAHRSLHCRGKMENSEGWKFLKLGVVLSLSDNIERGGIKLANGVRFRVFVSVRKGRGEFSMLETFSSFSYRSRWGASFLGIFWSNFLQAGAYQVELCRNSV
jgi:hypothetical protein